MADDRLDDAIDAVVRAVDRIERATRAPAPDLGVPSPPRPPLADATRPIQGSVGATGAFWAPRHDEPAPGGGQGTTGTTGPFDPGAGLGRGMQPPQSTAEFSALGAATVRPYAEHGASPEVHELVGRIVGRMQSLDDHLSAASQLRSEISELVARLAAAASAPR
ncbi:MAG: hypothetical protein Q7T55_14075 [Solirubrobacteraceae bacterium]|nr:hypothetical protein [Solirubrobacteraceae bacterium]